jgi:hypothetical protein
MLTFKFRRNRTGETEIWGILVPAAGPELTARFGEPLRVDASDSRFHEAGELFVIHGKTSSEFILACHFELTEEERNALLSEITLLVGREVFCLGSEFEPRWVLHDEIEDLNLGSEPE